MAQLSSEAYNFIWGEDVDRLFIYDDDLVAVQLRYSVPRVSDHALDAAGKWSSREKREATRL